MPTHKNIPQDNIGKPFLLAIFILAMLLRLLLASVNLQANDDHVGVIRIIMNENRIPTRGDCPECFQPKLYHLSMAAILKTLRVYSLTGQIRIAQYVNCTAGGMTLCVVCWFLAGLPMSRKWRTIGFACIALNPKFIGINAQATNDSFVIFFSTVCLYHALHFFDRWSIARFLYMAGSCILAALTKGNGLVLFPVILVMFSLKLLGVKNTARISRAPYAWSLLAFSFLYMLCVPYVGQYYQSYTKYGSPFVINASSDPAPNWIKRTYVRRPGVTSIVDTYMTFRIFGLLKTPYTTNHKIVFPLHRTSLWTQLYGRAHSVHFDRWPPSWETPDTAVQHLVRCIFLLALIPTALMAAGIIKTMLPVIGNVYGTIRHGNALVYDTRWIHGIALAAYAGFMIAFTFRHRDFSTMKVIFVFPGFLCFLYFFLEGVNVFYRKVAGHRRLNRCLDLSLIGLLALYCVDVVYLIVQLSLKPMP